jgi:hypothetical protein
MHRYRIACINFCLLRFDILRFCGSQFPNPRFLPPNCWLFHREAVLYRIVAGVQTAYTEKDRRL